MLKRIKKFLSFLFKRKIIFLLFLVLIIFGLFAPLYQAKADFKFIYLSPLYWIIKDVGAIFGEKVVETKLITFLTAIVVTLLQIPLAIANVFVGVAVMILRAVTSPDFITLSYTKLDNPIIQMGWTVTRDLANMGIVLALVVIGVTTILRIEKYEYKKTLPVLIIIALLINFTPVILGVIVDASNILMHFFLGDCMDASGFAETFSAEGRLFLDAWEEVLKSSKEIKAGQGLNLAPLGGTVALIFFGAIAGFIYLIFAILFVLRYVAIWMLVILSPLAFVCYILPATKEYFSKWWNQFLQWCFIGVIAAFFLYLSNGLLALAKGQVLLGKKGLISGKIVVPGEIVVPAEESAAGIVGLVNTLLPYYVVIGFLGLGLIATLSISAMGASTVVNFAKAKGKATVRGVGKGAGWVGKQAAKGVGRYVEEKLGLKEKVGKIAQEWSKHRGLRWFLPEGVKKYGEFRPAIDEARAKAKDYKSPVLFDDVMTEKAIGKEAGGNVLEGVMRGDSEDVFHSGRRKFGKDLTDEQLLHHEGFRKIMKRTLQVEKEGGYLNDVVRRDPGLAALLAGEEWAGDYYKNPTTGKLMTETEAIQKAARESRGGHIANMEKQVVDYAERGSVALTTTESFMERGRDPFENIARNVKEGVETVQGSIDKIFSNYIDNVLAKGDEAEKEIAALARQNDSTALDLSWERFQSDFKKQHQGKEGFFIALQGQRFRDLGYRRGQYKPPEPTGPMAAAVAGEKPGGPPPAVDTGEARERKRKEPDVGRVSVPIMITRKMKEELKKKGFSDEDISKMKPKDAWKELGGMS